MSRSHVQIHPVDGNLIKKTYESLCGLRHYHLPGLSTNSISTINNIDNAVEYYSAPTQFNLPMPYVTFSDIHLKTNAVMDSVNLKIQWKHKKKNLLKICQKKFSSKNLNNIKNQLLEGSSNSNIPLPVAKLASHLMIEPDPYFDSDYNWYFKNTIEKFQFNGKWYLACARGENLNNLDIISINNNKYGTVETKNVNIFEGPIFDIKSSNSNDLMIRQKTKLFVLRNNSETESLLDNKTMYENYNIPFTDTDITPNNFFTADVKHVLKQWKDGNCIQDKYFDVEYDQYDSFLRLSYLQNQSDIIALINRQKLYLTDSRIDISKHCSVYDPSTLLEICEELAALKISDLNNHSIYVATNHTILTLDNRMGFVNKSYHMLSNPPSLIASHYYENRFEPNEILFLGTHIGESVVNLSYTSNQDNFLECKTMVSSIPKPLESLSKVRLQGHCLNPILLDRFARCLTGTTAIGINDKDLKLFTINCVGDLFVQQINDTTPIDVAEFEKYVTIEPHIIPKLNYSCMFDMSKLWQLENPEINDQHVKQNAMWSISKENMTSYVDHLAPLILSPWDIDNLSEWGEENNIDTVNGDSDCDFKTKVHYWFNKNDNLLGMEKPSKPHVDSQQNKQNIISSALSSRTDQKYEISDSSSSGYTLSLKSD